MLTLPHPNPTRQRTVHQINNEDCYLFVASDGVLHTVLLHIFRALRLQQDHP
jgi:hypothetical protein